MRRDPGILARDPTRDIDWHGLDNRFVPVRASELIAALADATHIHGLAPEHVVLTAAALERVIRKESDAFIHSLDELYAAFSPDRETQPLTPLAEQRTPANYARLRRLIEYLLVKANYTRLTDVQVSRALRTASAYGLHVRLNPERVAELHLWVRGKGTAPHRRRFWRRLLSPRHWPLVVRGEMHEVSVYRRLAVVARLTDDPHVLVKLFKDIPEADIEALLPHAEVTMNVFDRLLVLGGGAGALGSAALKLLAFLTGSVVALSQLLWAVLFGTFMLLFRTVMGYRRTQSRRDSQRTRHLYFQNLANNSSALHTLAAMVSQEELKESLLAYAFASADSPPATVDELDRRVEAFVAGRFGAPVDFDCTDAVTTLERFGLLAARAPLTVLGPGPAVATLDTLARTHAGDCHTAIAMANAASAAHAESVK